MFKKPFPISYPRIIFAVLFIPWVALHAADPVTVRVDSPGFVFSPATWTGDAGRGGSQFRQAWSPGSYFRIAWTTAQAKPLVKILLDTSTLPPKLKPPQIAYCIDGIWKSRIPITNEIVVEGAEGAGPHELEVYLHFSIQAQRWGSEGKSGLNVLRVTGVQLDDDSKVIPAPACAKWALIVGDSITEGSGAGELASYSHLLGQALRTQGYEYGISACGWSGWLNQGDNPPGDVPGYYVVSHSVNGVGGTYMDAASRWNKLDGNGHSLLDARGRISAYGKDGQEPSLIFINYGTNDSLHRSNPGDTRASILQALAALRASAPTAQIIVMIPFGQYYAAELKLAVEAHKKTHAGDAKIAVIDLGPNVAKCLAAKNGWLGGVHPNDRGHALFAARIIPQVITILNASSR